MKKGYIKGLFLISLLFISASCKRDAVDPNEDNDVAYELLQGKWLATQQAATVDGQQTNPPEDLSNMGFIYAFSGTNLQAYLEEDKEKSLRNYTWRVSGGELIMRQQYSDRADIRKISFEGNDRMILTDRYVSLGQETVLTIQFRRY